MFAPLFALVLFNKAMDFGDFKNYFRYFSNFLFFYNKSKKTCKKIKISLVQGIKKEEANLLKYCLVDSNKSIDKRSEENVNLEKKR